MTDSGLNKKLLNFVEQNDKKSAEVAVNEHAY